MSTCELLTQYKQNDIGSIEEEVLMSAFVHTSQYYRTENGCWYLVSPFVHDRL